MKAPGIWRTKTAHNPKNRSVQRWRSVSSWSITFLSYKNPQTPASSRKQRRPTGRRTEERGLPKDPRRAYRDCTRCDTHRRARALMRWSSLRHRNTCWAGELLMMLQTHARCQSSRTAKIILSSASKQCWLPDCFCVCACLCVCIFRAANKDPDMKEVWAHHPFWLAGMVTQLRSPALWLVGPEINGKIFPFLWFLWSWILHVCAYLQTTPQFCFCACMT